MKFRETSEIISENKKIWNFAPLARTKKHKKAPKRTERTRGREHGGGLHYRHNDDTVINWTKKHHGVFLYIQLLYGAGGTMARTKKHQKHRKHEGGNTLEAYIHKDDSDKKNQKATCWCFLVQPGAFWRWWTHRNKGQNEKAQKSTKKHRKHERWERVKAYKIKDDNDKTKGEKKDQKHEGAGGFMP